MGNPVSSLARKLRNGRGSAPPKEPLATGVTQDEGDVEPEAHSVLILHPDSPLGRVWNNDKDAIYDEPEAEQMGARAKTPTGRTEEIWLDGGVYREIWDNDEDAVYDDL